MKMRTFQGLFVLVLSLCAAQVAMTEASLDFSIITLPKHPLPRTESKQTSREAQGELFNSLGVDSGVLNTALSALGDVVLSAAEQKVIDRAQGLVIYAIQQGAGTKYSFNNTIGIIKTAGIKKLLVDPSPLMQQLSLDLIQNYANTVGVSQSMKTLFADMANLAFAVAIPYFSGKSDSQSDIQTIQLDVQNLVQQIDALALSANDATIHETISDFLMDVKAHNEDQVPPSGNPAAAAATALYQAYEFRADQTYSTYLTTLAVGLIQFANQFLADNPSVYPKDKALIASLGLLFTAFGNGGKGDPTIFINSIQDLLEPLLDPNSTHALEKPIHVIIVMVDYSVKYAQATTSSAGQSGTVETVDNATKYLVEEATKDIQQDRHQGDWNISLAGYAGAMWRPLELPNLTWDGNWTPIVLDLGISVQWFLFSPSYGLFLQWSPIQIGQYIQLQSDLSVSNNVNFQSAFVPFSVTIGFFLDYPTPFIVGVRMDYSTQQGDSSPQVHGAFLVGLQVPLFDLWDRP